MKVIQNNGNKKVVAVIGSGDFGFYIPGVEEGEAFYVNSNGLVRPSMTPWSSLANCKSRKKVYEGESITVCF